MKAGVCLPLNMKYYELLSIYQYLNFRQHMEIFRKSYSPNFSQSGLRVNRKVAPGFLTGYFISQRFEDSSIGREYSLKAYFYIQKLLKLRILAIHVRKPWRLTIFAQESSLTDKECRAFFINICPQLKWNLWVELDSHAKKWASMAPIYHVYMVIKSLKQMVHFAWYGDNRRYIAVCKEVK